MAGFDCFRLVRALLLTTNFVASVQSYTEFHLEDKRICHPLGKQRDALSLSSRPDAAAIVKPIHTFQHWHVQTDRLCKFTFKAHKGEHLFAVIQNMSLRRNDTHCLDYIKFKRKDKHETGEFCGQIDRRKAKYRPWQEQRVESIKDYDNRIRQGFAEFDVDGEIETTIFVSKNPLERNETLDLTIVYTPYKDCTKIKTERDKYKSAMNYTGICLWKEYYCDDYHNCIDEICDDEKNCGEGESPDYVSNGTGTKVTIGAVTTMLLCFVIFVMGLYICRKYKKLCWSSDCAGPNVNVDRLSRIERDATTSTHRSVAVDPMLEVRPSLPSVLDKDLPPSYDSLFPDSQSHPSAI